MFKASILGLIPLTLSVVSLGAGVAPATAQTTYNYSATYDGFSNRSFIPPDRNEVIVDTESNDDPLGFNKLSGVIYSRVNPVTGAAVLDTNPNAFDLLGKPDGSFVFLGSNNDKLFATARANGLVDFSGDEGTESISGTINITGGEGRFSGAKGTLSLTGDVVVFSTPNVPEPTKLVLKGSITTAKVPEPSTLMALISVGVTGAGVLLNRRNRQVGATQKSAIELDRQ